MAELKWTMARFGDAESARVVCFNLVVGGKGGRTRDDTSPYLYVASINGQTLKKEDTSRDVMKTYALMVAKRWAKQAAAEFDAMGVADFAAPLTKE